MQSTMVNIYQVQVIFAATTQLFYFAGDMEYVGTTPTLSVPPGVHLIQFILITLPDPENPDAVATFESYPISFNSQPNFPPLAEISQPVNFVPNVWFDANRCCLMGYNINNGSPNASFRFTMTVSYEGVPYTSPDPTIINEPPGGSN